MNLDMVEIQRVGYTFLDYLSDVGGMQVLLLGGINYFLAFWNYQFFDNYLVTRLFKLEKLKESEKRGRSYFNRSTFMKPTPLYNPKEWIRTHLPKFLVCKCCLPNRLEKGFEKARDHLKNEVNIIEIIKARRYFKKALKYLLSKKIRMKLK